MCVLYVCVCVCVLVKRLREAICESRQGRSREEMLEEEDKWLFDTRASVLFQQL